MEEQEIDLRDYIEVIWKRRKLIIEVFFIAVVVALIASLIMPKVYEASVTFMINRPKYQVALEPKIQTLISSEVSVDTYRNLIVTKPLEEQVINELTKINPAYANITPDQLENMIKMKEIKNTNLVEIKIKADSPEKAMYIIDTWAKLFIAENEYINSGEAKEAQFFINDQMKVTGQNLDKQEEQLSQFNEKNKIDLLRKEIADKTDQIARYEKDMTELALLISVKESELKQIEEELKEQNEKVVLSKSITDDQELQQTAKEITKENAAKLNALRFNSELLNPTYSTLIQQRAEARVYLSANKEKLSYLKNNIDKFTKEFLALKKELAWQELAQSKLSRQMGAINQTYNILSQKAEETRIAAATKPGLIKIVKDAYASKSPVSPSKRKNVLVGGIVGLMFGIFLAFFMEYLGPKKD